MFSILFVWFHNFLFYSHNILIFILYSNKHGGSVFWGGVSCALLSTFIQVLLISFSGMTKLKKIRLANYGPSSSIIQLVNFGCYDWGVWVLSQTFGRCLCLFIRHFQLINICVLFLEWPINETIRAKMIWCTPHVFDCLRVLVFLALNLQHFLFQPEKKNSTKTGMFLIVLVQRKAVVQCRTTHRHVWRRNCWRTPGCQHCNWGGRVSLSHSGWCYTAGQQTWRRCVPALWSAWTVRLRETKCHIRQRFN